LKALVNYCGTQKKKKLQRSQESDTEQSLTKHWHSTKHKPSLLINNTDNRIQKKKFKLTRSGERRSCIIFKTIISWKHPCLQIIPTHQMKVKA
jgi:hypothetical protein